MSEHIYNVEGKKVIFSENADIGCLCTFPHNDMDDGDKLVIGNDRLIELALLGIVVALLHNTTELDDKECIYIPNDIMEYYDAIKKQEEDKEDGK